MPRPQSREKGAWDSFRIWMHANQRIIWVVLLILVCFSFGFVGPVQDFFMSAAQPSEKIYGRPVSQGEWRIAERRMETVLYVLGAAREANVWSPLPGGLSDAMSVAASMRESAFNFYAFAEKARRLGLRVSDRELGDYIRVLWQTIEAGAEAAQAMPPPPEAASKDPNERQKRIFEYMDLKQKKDEEYRKKPFDLASWARIVNSASARGGAILPAEFEQTLRELLLITKLQQYIKSTVKVTPQEIYEKYREEKQTRKLSWNEVPVTDELKEKAAKTLTPDDLRLHYEANRGKFELPASIQVDWLLLPRAHFEKLASEKITAKDLEDYYKLNRNEYRRPTVLPEEAAFDPRPAEKQAALDKALFYSLDDIKDNVPIKDKVREKVLEQRTRSEILDFAEKLRVRLHPPKSAAGEAKPAAEQPPASFGDLVKEFSFLVTGSTGYVSAKDAEAGFGAGYSSQVKQWFDAAEKAEKARQRPSLKAPEYGVTSDKGMVFYSGLAYRRSLLPTLRESEAKVRESAALEKALELARGALTKLSDEVNRGERDIAALAAAPIEVEVAGAKVALTAQPLRTATQYVGRNGTVTVEKPAEEKPAVEKVAAKEPAREKVDPESEFPAEEAIPASEVVRDAGFSVEEKGKTGVAVSAEAKAAYLVRVDDIIPPDPKGFEVARDSIERELVRTRETKELADWQNQIRSEASDRRQPVEGEEGPKETGEPGKPERPTQAAS